jgi:hypothetical protein
MKNLTQILLITLALALSACGSSVETTQMPQPLEAEIQPESAANLEAPVLTTLSRITDAQVLAVAVQMRQGPGAQCSQMGVVHRGQLVDVLAADPTRDWLLINSAGLSGWVPMEDMALIGLVDDLPVVEPASLQPDRPWRDVNMGKNCLA